LLLVYVRRIEAARLLGPFTISEHYHVILRYFSACSLIPPTMHEIRAAKDSDSVPVSIVTEADKMDAPQYHLNCRVRGCCDVSANGEFQSIPASAASGT
jgi:hypothetical protein